MSGVSPKRLGDLYKSQGVRRTSAHSPANVPVVARWPGHDHTTPAKEKRGLGTGLNAPHCVTPALPHHTAGCSPACVLSWRSLRTIEVGESIAGLALNLLMASDLPRQCETEPGSELLGMEVCV